MREVRERENKPTVTGPVACASPIKASAGYGSACSIDVLKLL